MLTTIKKPINETRKKGFSSSNLIPIDTILHHIMQSIDNTSKTIVYYAFLYPWDCFKDAL